MTTKSILVAAGLALASLASGCSMVSSASPGSTVVTGEAWYARSSTFTGSLKGIYYCDGQSAVCRKAEIRR